MVRETRHLWVGNLPENIREEEIVKHFTRYGRVESVKILPKRSAEGGRAAFVDFVDIRSATKAHESVNRIGDREMRTDYNEPGNAGNISRLHGHTDPPSRPTGNTAPGSPAQRRRFERRPEGVLVKCGVLGYEAQLGLYSISSGPDGRYNGRSQAFYQDDYSEDETGSSRVSAKGGGTASRSRPRSSGDHRRQPYSHEPRRNTHKLPEAYRDQEPSPDRTSGSESGSESSHSGSQSASSSGSSSSEEDSRAGSAHGNAAPPAEVPQSTNRTSALCLRNISLRSGDSGVRDGLYHEFKKHGDVTRISVNGQGTSRYAIVQFRRPEDAERSLEACRGKPFLGSEMDLQYWQTERYDSSEHSRHRAHASSLMDEEFEAGCTRTLFVGNIEKSTTYSDLKEAFERYGEIVDVDIKKQTGNNPYAFIQFVELSSAIQARRRMDREFVGRNRVKVGFGKVSPINTIWVGMIGDLSEQQIERHFSRYGRVTKVVVNYHREQALVSFDSVESASIAQGEMKGRSMFGRRVKVEFVSRDSRQLFNDALQRSAPSDSSSSSRRYEPSSPRTRGRGIGPGYYDNRWDRGRGGRGMMRREMSNHRPWHRSGGNYDYPEGSGYHQKGHARYRSSYEMGGDESDDYDQELRDYNFSRQREREKEQGRQRHERGTRDRDREDGTYSANERFYQDNQERWPENRSSSGSYEEPRDRKDTRSREFPVEPDRERAGYSEDDERAAVHSKPSSRDIEQEEKRPKRKDKKRRKPRSPTPETVDGEKETVSGGEGSAEKRGLEEKEPRKGSRDGDTATAVQKGKEGTRDDVWDERRVDGNGTRALETLVKDGERELAPASPPPEKGVRKKEKRDVKKRRKHRRFRASLGEEEEERELQEETVLTDDAAGKEASDVAVSVSKPRDSVAADLHAPEIRDGHVPESKRFGQPEFESKKPVRRHSAEDRPSREEREFPRESESRSPRKSHRDERRRDWEKTDGVRQKRRRMSDGESPPPPPPPPPPPREVSEGYPPTEMLTRVGPSPDGLPAQVSSYDIATAPPVHYDGTRSVPLGSSPATLSPIPPPGIPLNPAVAAPANVSTPPLTVHSPGLPIGVPVAPDLGSPQGLPPPPPPHSDYNLSSAVPQPSNTDTLLDLLRRYPVVWQGLLALKNDSAAVQMHYLAGNGRLAEVSLPQAPTNGVGGVPPPIRIAQRMKLEPSQLEGVIRRMQSDKDHCLLLALPCGRDPLDVHAQTRALKSGFINYLQQKQAAGIINVARPGSSQPSYVLHIFPPCDFAQEHLARVSPDLLDSAADSGHLMVVVASV